MFIQKIMLKREMQKSTFNLNIKYILLSLILWVFTLTSCINSNKNEGKKPVFLADREAPIGWSYLEIFEDSTFEFIGNEFQGTVSIQNDTFLFKYNGEIPKAGNKAIIEGKHLIYINGKYLEKLEIKLNEMKK